MGAVLFMLLALVLPVAPAGAVGDVQDESIVTEGTVTASFVDPRALYNECAANISNQGKTSYYLTLASSTGTRIPAVNGGTPATVNLIGVGSGNLGQIQPMAVGDLESKARPGFDRDVVTKVPTSATDPTLINLVIQKNGVCQATDAATNPLPAVLVAGNVISGDDPPATNDGLLNDYGTANPVPTGTCFGALTCTWKILISAPGHVSQLLDVTALVDGAPINTLGPAGVASGVSTPGALAAYGGTGCLEADRGCVASIGIITLQALTVPQAGRGSISGTVTDVTGLPLTSAFGAPAGIVTCTVQVVGVAICTTAVAHLLTTGDTVTIVGNTVSGFNVTTVVTVLNSTQFTVPVNTNVIVAVAGTGGTVQRGGSGVEIVLYRQPDQDPTNDATQPIPENSAQSILTDPNTGQYFVNNLWPGRYSVTVADTRVQACVIPGTVTPALNANCGIQPATKVVPLFPVAFPQPTGDVMQQTVNFAVPIDIAAAQAPGQALTATTTGFFGYVIDGSSGGRMGSLTPGQFGFNPNGGSGGLAAPIQLIFTPVQPTPCATGLNPPSANSTCIGSITAATTDTNGRYQVVLTAGIQYAVSISGFANAVTNLTNIGLVPTGGLPLGFTGSCTVGGNNPSVPFPGTLFPCGFGVEGTDRFTLSSTALLANAWNGGGTFVLVPSSATQIPGIGQTTVRRLEAVIPGIYRNPDTSYTGVDVETIQVRVMNNGVQRTGAQIEWFSTSSDDVASLVKTDTLDLNPGASGIFTRSVIPDGCTRCMAQIFSIDLDAPNPFLGPGFLPTNTPAVPGVNGFVYGLSDLQATVTHRVVDAGNALAGGNGITFEDIFPTGNSVNSAFTIPLVYKNYGGGVHKWSSIVTGCLTRGVGGPQPIVFDFFSAGESRGGPFQITRSTNPGGCISLNLNTFDPNDPDYFDPLAGVPDGTYSVVITSTAGTNIPTPPEVPGGFFASALSYSITGRMATLGNGSAPIGGENAINGFRELYAPLVFKRYNDWNTGIAVSGFRPRTPFLDFAGSGGGSGAGASIAVYGEDGTMMGVFLDGISRSSAARVYYLPTLPIQLPDGFRGSVIISVGDNTGGTRTSASVQQVNYERNQATSYNFITQDQSVRLPTPNARPCTYPVNSTTDPNAPQAGPPNTINPLTGLIQNPTNYVSCLTVPDAQRRFGGAPRGSGATFEVGLGPTTGVRLFNPDPFKNGTSAYVVASNLDSAGIVSTASYITFSIPAYHTATYFMGADTGLPDIWDGSMFIQATAPIVGIGNVVDYRITDRDASYSFNLPNQSGRTN